MKILFLFIIGIHGIIHLIGFVKAFNLAEINQLTKTIPRTAGLFWLVTSLLFIITLLMILLKYDYWWLIAALAIFISQLLIIQNWNDAKAGTAANIIILIPVIISLMNSLPSSYHNIYRNEVLKRLSASTDTNIVSDDSIRHLPEPVKKYLKFSGSIGRPVVKNFKVNFEGQMKKSISSDWMNISSEQYNFIDNPARLFYISSNIAGIPFDGLHSYIGSEATMQIKIASFIKVVDARGEKMNQSENVTIFNDMCLLAPATLIDKNIKWESIDPLTVKAKFTHNNITITAQLYFNNNGELINFISDDRFLSSDGKKYLNYRWSTPVKSYKDFNGRKAVGYAEAIWSMPEGEFSYAKFDLTNIEYNCSDF